VNINLIFMAISVYPIKFYNTNLKIYTSVSEQS
jgi:hypothetical protein